MLVACRHAGRSALNSKAYHGCWATARNSRSGREPGFCPAHNRKLNGTLTSTLASA